MSADRDLQRVVRSWLREDGHEDADRVLNLALDELDTTPQRRAGWLARRLPIMSNGTVRYGIAAVAVAAAVILGLNFLPQDVGGPGPTSTPTPTPSPSPSVPPPPISDGSLDAGTYSFDFEPAITVDVPAGWDGCCGGAAIVAGQGQGAAIFGYDDVTGITVYGDSCQWMDSTKSQPRGAEAIAAALAAQPGRAGTDPTEVSVGGTRAFHVRLTVPVDLETAVQPDGDADFIGCDGKQYRTYETVAGSIRYQQGPEQVDDLYIVDVAGRTLLFDLSHFPRRSISQVDELEAMLASIQID